VIPSLSSGAAQIERSPTLGFLILVPTSINLSPLNTHNGRAWLTLADGLSRYSALFATIYKILPDKPISWRDIDVCRCHRTVVTTGKSLIGLYIGSIIVASGYGCRGSAHHPSVRVLLGAVFLLGAQFTLTYVET
jgi:uncharacterized BrkB/YihY/UPF0761 family membrane protein